MFLRALILIAVLFPAHAFANVLQVGGNTPVACTASAPTQASGAGLNTLAMCNSFSGNNAVDINNTQNAGYLAYTQSVDTNFATAPASFFSNDGTGISMQSNIANQNPLAYYMLTVGHKPTSPYYQGTPLQGQSFYAEIDQKFNRKQPTSDNTWPALWGGGAIYSLNGTYQPGNWPFVEIDFLECLPAGVGLNCTFNQQLHVWQDVGGVGTLECSYGGGYGGTYPTDTTVYHTYGIRFLMPADNAGVEEFDYYVDNTKTLQCTESGGVVSCTHGSNGTGINCGTYDLTPMETQVFTFIFGGAYQWPVTLRNFHVWTK